MICRVVTFLNNFFFHAYSLYVSLYIVLMISTNMRPILVFKCHGFKTDLLMGFETWLHSTKLTSVFHVSVILFIWISSKHLQSTCGSAEYFDSVMTKLIVSNRTDVNSFFYNNKIRDRVLKSCVCSLFDNENSPINARVSAVVVKHVFVL